MEEWANGTNVSCQSASRNREADQTVFRQNYTTSVKSGSFGLAGDHKWISGKSLPSLDDFIILSRLLHTSIEDILVIDGDISFSRIFLNYRFNDIPARLSYNHTIRKRYGKSVRREKLMKNCETGRTFHPLLPVHHCVDHEGYLCRCSVCLQNQVPVRFGHEFKRNEFLRTIITCRVWKKDIAGLRPWNHCIARCSCSVIAIMQNS